MENNKQKLVTLGNLEALSGVLATKEEVKEQIKDATEDTPSFEFATDEEVLALFQSTTPEEWDENGGEGGGE